MSRYLGLREGQVLQGRLRVDAFLGQGAMGFVVRATDLAAHGTVAIKLLTDAHPAAAQRFMREGRVASRLKSPHVAHVLDVGICEEAQGAPFLVMEYLQGEDLSALLKRTGPLGVVEATTYVKQACDALAEAHELGVVHRDIKPANLMLTAGPGGAPRIKVLDFGVSKAVGRFGVAGTQEASLTAPNESIGSPLYMAPEQINDSANVDGRADLWSLGVVLYQLLTGTTPWVGASLYAFFARLASEPPTPIKAHRPDVPEELMAIIARCLEKDLTRRWPDARSLADALAPFTTTSMPSRPPGAVSASSPPGPPLSPAVSASVAPSSTGPVAFSQNEPAPLVDRSDPGNGGSSAGVVLKMIVAGGLALAASFALVSARVARRAEAAALAPASSAPEASVVEPAASPSASQVASEIAPSIAPETALVLRADREPEPVKAAVRAPAAVPARRSTALDYGLFLGPYPPLDYRARR